MVLDCRWGALPPCCFRGAMLAAVATQGYVPLRFTPPCCAPAANIAKAKSKATARSTTAATRGQRRQPHGGSQTAHTSILIHRRTFNKLRPAPGQYSTGTGGQYSTGANSRWCAASSMPGRTGCCGAATGRTPTSTTQCRTTVTSSARLRSGCRRKVCGGRFWWRILRGGTSLVEPGLSALQPAGSRTEPCGRRASA